MNGNVVEVIFIMQRFLEFDNTANKQFANELINLE
jgi:hypothetical protein